MLQPGAEWFGAPGATAEQLDELRAIAPEGVPNALYALLAHSNGGEGPLPVRPMNFVLDDARAIAQFITARPYGSVLDGFLVVGADGGGEFVAVDLRSPGETPVVVIDMVAGPSSAVLIARSFEAFVSLIGFET